MLFIQQFPPSRPHAAIPAIQPLTMSYTSYTDARLFHTSSPKPRKTLRSPQRNIAFRNHYIAETKTVLVLKPFGSPHSAVAYKITEDDGTPTFTVSGRKYGDRSCREFRDASGLPLFELHRKWGWTISWSVSLPGCDTATIATGTPRVGGFGSSAGNLNLNFENAAAFELKSVDEKMLTLRVERHGNALAAFDVVDGDRKVAEIKESIQHNEKLALVSRQGWRPALDVIVMPGVDISLVATIAVIVSDWVFGSK